MGRLKLGLGLEALGFRAAPPLEETTKGEEIKVKRLFVLITMCFFCFFASCLVSCCFSAVHLLLAITFATTCSSFCVIHRLVLLLFTMCITPHLAILLLLIMVHCLLSCVTTTCFGSWPSSYANVVYYDLSLLLLVLVPHVALSLFVVVPCLAIVACYGPLPCNAIAYCGPSHYVVST